MKRKNEKFLTLFTVNNIQFQTKLKFRLGSKIYSDETVNICYIVLMIVLE